MQIDRLGNNETLILSKHYTVLFSYDTPVAYFNGNGYKKTDQFWGVTTSRHINKWLEGIPEERIEIVPQSQIDEIANKI